MKKILKYEINLLGSILHPFQAWLLNRSLRTLPLRMGRHEATGNEVAAWLETREEVEVVNHVSLPSYPQRDLYLKMMTGSAGLFSFQTRVQDGARVKRFVDSLKIFQRGVSWGGHESLAICLPVKPMGYEKQTWIVRLSCGLEDPADLIADLDQAMALLA